MNEVRGFKIGVTLTLAVSLAIVLLAPSPVVPAVASEVGTWGAPLELQDFSAVPQPLVDEANRLAANLFGNNRGKRDDFVSQLLATYLVAKDKDVVVIFNSGGWGWTPVEEIPDWQGIITGIGSELADSGHSTLFLNHLRTARTLNGCLSELMLAAELYPPKTRDLATRVEFLTRNIPGISVILVGQSNGADICEGVMKLLGDNQQLYSIQLGPPFWDKTTGLDSRSLVLRSNGTIPDSFSQGDMFTVIRANLEALFGISQKNPGHILFYIGAPGHDYGWQYEAVRSQIISFLEKHWPKR
jgi:hypothetical protein